MLAKLRRGELTGGGWPRSLLDLPEAFLERLDASPETSSRRSPEPDRETMPSLLRQLGRRMMEHEDPQAPEFRELIFAIGKRVCESAQQRGVFADCQGDVLLVQLLVKLVPAESEPITAPVVINECVQILVRRLAPPAPPHRSLHG